MGRLVIIGNVEHDGQPLDKGLVELPDEFCQPLVDAGVAVWEGDEANLVDPQAAEAERLALERFEQMQAILAGKTEDVLAAAAEMEPDELAELLSLEQASDKPRKGVIEGIEAELADRAEGDEA